MLGTEGIYEHRSLTNDELAAIIAKMREARGWTQETLAELAGVTVRTVQRVEGGEPSSADTRRALARALEWQDIDTFNQPWPFPNIERLQAEQARIERETTAVPVSVIARGRELRELAELAEGWQPSQMGELSKTAAENWAALQEYFTDYGDINHAYSPSQKLGVDDDLQGLMDALGSEGLAICGGTRRVRFGGIDGAEGISATVVHLLIGPSTALPSTLRVPRKTSMAW